METTNKNFSAPTAKGLGGAMKRAAMMLLLSVLTTAQTAWAIRGSGTSSDPYTIANTEDWNTFCSNFSSYKDKYIKLTGNFTTSTVVDSSTPFTGNFDGAGHTITLNYSLQGTATGLFRYVDATGAVIKNLNVAGTITANQNVTPENDGIGGIVGKLGQGTVQNCTSSVTINDNGHTLGHVGGLVGAIYAATVQDCSFTGTLSCGNSSDCIGGIVGYAKYDKSFVIKNCLSTGSISVKSTTGAGAILGYVNNNNHTSNSKNNYWKSNGVNQTNGGGGSIGGASKTDAQLKYGQISRLLNGGNGSTESANGAWGNTVGSNYPTLGGPKVYKVSFNANGGNGSMSDAYTNATPLPSNSFTRSGYGFDGWSTSANGSPISKVSSDGILYALWIPPVNYIDANGSSQSVYAKSLLSDWTTLSAGWYVVNNDVTIGSRVTCTGAVHLILADGKTLTASMGITVNSGNSLTIYGQSGQAGKLTTGTPNEAMAGIGGVNHQSSGNITINGGTVNATGGYEGAGIGGGHFGNGSVTINGGTVSAIGGSHSAGIGGGNYGNGSVTISGGTVSATGGSYGSGIGGGYRGNSSVTISGGYIEATAGEEAAAIGDGYSGSGSTINITGGMFASGDAGGNKVYGITPSNGYAVFSSGNTTYPYQVCPAATVTFKANGGTGNDYNQYIKKNTATALKTCGFTRTGYAFAGWATSQNGNVVYADGQSVTLNADLTLYAQWKGVLTNSMIADIAAQAYTGSAITPTVTVSFDGEHNLTLNTDYTVSYANNVNAGTATVTVTGKGNYTGTATKEFKIYSNQSLVGATITLPYTYYAYKGAALTPIPTVKYGETTLTEGTDYTLLYSDNTNAGMATVTVTGTGNYTGAGSATFTIVNIPLNSGRYQIGSPEQLLAFMELCNDNSSTTYSAQQTADIDLNNADWTGIGSFKGTYDGQYHTILHMGRNNQHTQSGVNPFMGTIETGATVKDLTISEAIVWPGHGDAGFFAGNNKGTLSRCVAIGGRAQSGQGHVGGIAGYNNGTMTDCAVINSAVNHRWTAGGASHTGGVVQQNNGTMQNCFAYGVNYGANNTPKKLGGINLENNAPTNSYFYNTHSFFTDGDASNNSSVDGTLITADQCGSGQTARLLNGGNGTAESASGAWGQTIGKDKYPVLGGPAVYKVTYNANGGTGTMDAQYLNSGQSLTANAFTRTGYTFAGWNTQANGGGTSYTDGQEVINLAASGNGTVTLYAQWTQIPVTYLDENGDEQTKQPSEYTPIADVPQNDNGTRILTAGQWYVVNNDIEIHDDDGINVTGNGAANIILCDGKTLNYLSLRGNINGSLNIYGQSEGTGSFYSDNNNYYWSDKSYIIDGNLTIYGGQVTLIGHTGGGGESGYGESQCAIYGDVTLYRGSLYAKGGDASYDDGLDAICGKVYFYGGSLTAIGGEGKYNDSEGGYQGFDGNGISGNVSLSWTNVTDRFYANKFGWSSVTIAQGKTFTDGTNIYSGTYTQNQSDALAGKTLYPAVAVTLGDGITTGSGIITSSENHYAQVGQTVTVNASNVTVPAGYAFSGITVTPNTVTVTDNHDDTYSFNVPAADVTVSANLNVIDWAKESTGDAEHPYMIYNKDQLNLLAYRVNGTHGESYDGNGYYSKYFKLGADIIYPHTTAWNDATSTEDNYEAIGNYASHDEYRQVFRGHFDGDGHTISGIRIYKGITGPGTTFQGLFGYTANADIHDVILADSRITAYNYTGGIIGWNTSSNITRCHVAADVTIHAVQDASNHGGITGLNRGTVSHCTSSATLTVATGVTGTNNFGAITGTNSSDPVGTLTDNLVIGATVPAVSYENHHGAITGWNGGILERNYYVACTVAGVENATGMGCMNADITANDGVVPALRDNADNTTAIGLLAALASTADGHVPVDLGWGAGKYPVQLTGRTLYKDGAWNTLCLPFDVSTTSGPLSGDNVVAKVLVPSGTSLSDGLLTLSFENATTIEAGTPFIIKWTKTNTSDPDLEDLVNPVFSGVSIDNSTAAQNRMTVSADNGNVQFVGQYSPFEIVADNATLGDNQGYLSEIVMLGSGSTLGYSNVERTIANGKALRSFRAHFCLPVTKGGSRAMTRYAINFGEEEASGITTTNVTNDTNSADSWYTLDGRKLNGSPSRAGMYIRGGRKVVIK